MKIYGVSDRFYNYRIEEFEVEKETEATYVVVNNKDRFFNSRYTIRKKDMSNCSYDFTLTYEEALARKENLIRFEIDNNCKRIKSLKNRNEELNNLLDAMED